MTQKEYTGPEEFTGEQFEIEFARAWYEYVKSQQLHISGEQE